MDVLDETYEMYEKREGQRPVFITVLCILTWVGSFLGLIGGVIQLFTYSAMNAIYKSNALQGMSNLPGVPKSTGHLFWVAIATMVGCVFCALGAVFMFRLKKSGFFIYLFGQILPLIGSFYSMLVITSEASMFRGLGIFGGIVGMLFPIAFIIMYGVNLKHMNK